MDGPNAIAIVGIGCKFPGAENVDEFWRVLLNGEDHVQDIPPERFNVNAFYDADHNRPGRLYMKKAGLIKGFTEWDNQFYGIGEMEAKQIDPQQRFVLDCVHMAMEDGGITKEHVNESDTGVYIGMMNDDYKFTLTGEDDLINNYTVTGLNSSLISARVSYHYNLLGPSIVLDTACSSGLVSIHLGVSAIAAGDISMAICGGVNCIINPEVFIQLSKAHMASPTGKCHTFSRHADGYARGEGCGIILMKKLTQAIKDRNKIWGVIATGCNQDGRTTSPITAPSQTQQIKLLEKVFTDHSVDPSWIQYIEAHGTGTPVGDPIEANALGTFFSRHREKSSTPLLIGSVKTNIGHLESAAGVAGLIKMLLMMKHELYVPSLHSDELNAKILFVEHNLEVSRTVSKWLPLMDTATRLGCINSFGFGGTNCHTVIKHISHTKKSKNIVKDNKTKQSRKIVVISANDKTSLKQIIQTFTASLPTTEFDLDSISYTSTVRRDHYRFRTYAVTNSLTALKSTFEMKIQNIDDVEPIPLHTQAVAFVFCGVGTAWNGMCFELIEKFPVFRNAVKEVDELLVPLTNWSIFQVLSEKEEFQQDPLVTHLAIFTCQVALVHLWQSFGIQPKFIVGQSVGEVAAAYASHALTLRDAVKVIFYRSKYLAEVTGGQMVVVRGVQIEDVEHACKRLMKGRVVVAAYISPECCTVSGDEQAIDELKGIVELQPSASFIDLNVKCAYHSHFTNGASQKVRNALYDLTPSAPNIEVFSSVIGKQISPDGYCTPEFWANNVRSPVLFQQAVMESTSIHNSIVFLEIGPSPVLRAHKSSLLPNEHIRVMASMTKRCEHQVFLETIGNLYTVGINPIWNALCCNEACLSDIPKYVFNKRNLFQESLRRSEKRSLNTETSSTSNLLQSIPNSGNTFAVTISNDTTPYVYEHIVDGQTIVPGALYGEIGLEIGRNVFRAGVEIELTWEMHTPLYIINQESITLRVNCEITNGSVQFNILEKNNMIIASGTVQQRRTTKTNQIPVSGMIEKLNSKLDDEFIYKNLRNIGFRHGPLFQIIKKGIYRKDECFVEVDFGDNHMLLQQNSILHTIIIDGMLQCCSGHLPFMNIPANTKLFPAKIGKLVCRHQVRRKMYILSKLCIQQISTNVCNAILLQENGLVIAEMRGIETRILHDKLSKLSYSYSWQQMTVPIHSITGLQHSVSVVSWNQQICNAMSSILNCKQVFLNDTDTFEKSSKCIDRHLQDNPNTTVIYIPGYNNDQLDMDVENVYHKVLRSGKMMLHIAKRLINTSSKIICVTEATQNCSVGNEKLNVIGSEIWGIARCISLEPTQLSFNLIDAFPNILDTRSRLKDLLIDIFQDIKFPMETCVIQKNVKFGFIKQMPFTHQLPPHVTDGTLRYQHIPTSYARGQQQSNNVLINLNMACKTPLLTAAGDMDVVNKSDDIWNTEHEHRLNTHTTEFVGNVLSDGFMSDREVICCQPGRIETRLVQRDLICSKDEIPHYSLGMMQSCILALHITDRIRKHSTVGVIASKDFWGTMNFLREFESKKKMQIKFYESIGQMQCMDSTLTCLVLLTLDPLVTTEIPIAPNISTIVCLGTHIQEASVISSRATVLPVTYADLFDTWSLPQKFKAAKKVLQKMDKQGKLNNSFINDTVDATPVNMDINEKSKLIIREKSSYVVVGGHTGLGWLIVKYLSKLRAHRVIIMSRRNLNEEMRIRIESIATLYSNEIVPCETDICNLSDLIEKFKALKIICKSEPIRGIFHGAVVTADSFASGMTMDMFEQPMRPKVLGTLNLDYLSRSLDLDFFVMHSSISSIIGNIGQCNYAAGNAFQDSMALYRRSIGLPAQVINWGALDIGLATDPVIRDSLKSKGFNIMSSGQIEESLTNVLTSTICQSIVADIDWYILLQPEYYIPQRKKFKEFGNFEKVTANTVHHQTSDIDNAIQSVKRIIASVFTLDDSQILCNVPLTEFGLDSQKGTELANLLFEEFHVGVPHVFMATERYTIEDIAKYIVSKQGMVDIETGSHRKQEEMRNSLWEQFILQEFAKVKHRTYSQVRLTMQTKVDAHDLRTCLYPLFLLSDDLRVSLLQQKDNRGNIQITKSVMEIEDAILNIKTGINELACIRKNEKPSFQIEFQKNKREARILLLLCPLMFDTSSVESITNHAIQLLLHLEKRSDSYKYHIIENCTDSVLKLDSLVKYDENTVKRFWQEELSQQQDIFLCLRNEAKLTDALQTRSIEISEFSTKILQEKLMEQDITFFQGLSCINILAIYVLTLAEQITLLIKTDLRGHVGVKRNTIGMYSNILPIVTQFDNTETLSEFFARNVMKFRRLVEKSLYPFSKLGQLSSFDSSKHQAVLFAYTTVEQMNGHSSDGVIPVSFLPGFSSLARIEITAIRTKHNLRLIMRSQEPKDDPFLTILDVMEKMIELYIEKPTMSIGHLTKCNPPSVSSKTERLYQRNGRSRQHPVEPKLSEDRQYLVIGKRKIRLEDITSSSVDHDDMSFYLEIQTKKKKYRYFSKDLSTCKKWALFLKDNKLVLPNLGKQCGSHSSLCYSLHEDKSEKETEFTHL